MQKTGLDHWMIGDLLQDIAPLLEATWSLGAARSKMWWLNLQLKQRRSMAHGVCEVLWLKILLMELGLFQHKPLLLYCDNKAALDIAHNPVQHDRTKHIEIDRHFIKEKLDHGIICMPYVCSSDQLADILTKALPEKVFSNLCSKMGLYDAFTPS